MAKGEAAAFVPTRAAGLDRLRALAPVVRQYAARRNHAVEVGEPPTTSRLSPYLRRRLVLEDEALDFARSAGGFDAVEKFVQEVVWRTYWKGWLEARPQVWAAYLDRLSELDRGLPKVVRRKAEEAASGATDLPYFNAWAAELKATGWLHNHARMWFASIWVFTLKLPWELGAKLFLEHLCDGDPASNTLSWRWVAGLQTPGKHYLARAENIAKYTGGRWTPRPGELDESPRPLADDGLSRSVARRIPLGPDAETVTPAAVILHGEDCGPLPAGWRAGGCRFARLVTPDWPHHTPSGLVRAFVAGAWADADARVPAVDVAGGAAELVAWAAGLGVSEVWAIRPAVGFAAPDLADIAAGLAARGITLRCADRGHDRTFLSLATKGFFPFWSSASRVLRASWP